MILPTPRPTRTDTLFPYPTLFRAPGGSPAFFEGEIAPDNTPGERVKSSAPVIDLTARVDALEEQLQALPGQTEQNAYQLRELEKQFTTYKAEMDKKLSAPATAQTAEIGRAPGRKRGGQEV